LKLALTESREQRDYGMNGESTHGGVREGAGRKPIDPEAKATTRSITLPPDAWGKVDRLRGEESPSTFLRGVIQRLRKKRP
tara:strand:+ start:295 stop:537 length:243 start_codon:yes stop_codon:yes gene_type:complete